MLFLYNLSIFFYRLAVRVASLWNEKAARWIKGRQELFASLEEKLSPGERRIWMHCSSAGEFEQGKPVIESLKREFPGYKVIVSFFSPSGYSVARSYPYADVITFLPSDSGYNANRFLDAVKPEVVIFIKYDYWYHHLAAVAKRRIPLLLVSAVFRKNQVFFSPFGGFHRKMLFLFSHLFVQDQTSLELLKSMGVEHASIGGDTRFDRVMEIAARAEPIEGIEEFLEGKPALVAGSTWPDDEKLLASVALPKMIIAPHEINAPHLEQLAALFPGSVRYSQLNKETGQAPVLVIDNVGMLSRLYKYAAITYVGGGFTRDGIHNILEPAVFQKPVLFGPRYQKYREAFELIDAGGGLSVSDQQVMKATLQKFAVHPELIRHMGEKAGQYVRSKGGATQQVIHYIQENRLLTRP